MLQILLQNNCPVLIRHTVFALTVITGYAITDGEQKREALTKTRAFVAASATRKVVRMTATK